jgi:multiple sugar transport system substrate-binding protein
MSQPATGRRRLLIASACATAWPALSRADSGQGVLTVAAFPLLDEIIKTALPRWKQMHPGVELRVLSRQYSDHHTAMTTALSTSTHLPDVMALEVSFVGRFAHGTGLDDLRQPPYDIAQHRAKWVPAAVDQATNARGEVIAAPTDIGPGTMLYRTDLLEKAGVAPEDLSRSWDSYIAAGKRIKAKTGAYLVSHVQSVKDIVIRTGIKAGRRPVL